MNRMLSLRSAGLASIVVVLALAMTMATAYAKGPSTQLVQQRAAPSGWDISWPQCPSNFPRGGAFGIAGVTNGRPWGANPCLAAEFKWAAGYATAPQLFMNTANPAPTSSFYWPATGAYDPALCRNAASTTDAGCAYDYGWHAAANALATAGGATSTPAAYTWWLDVETGNSWNGDGQSNAADIQGSLDYLSSRGVAKVGIYSTGYQWTAITGGYTTSSAASYAAAWNLAFNAPHSQYVLASSPDWVPGASSAKQAPTYCTRSFSGAAVALAQYPSGGFDADLRCS
jgi:hypothetical protein